MRILREESIPPLYVTPDDSIRLTYRQVNSETGEVLFDETILEAHPEKADTYDIAIVFQIENELGFAAGIGGMLVRRPK